MNHREKTKKLIELASDERTPKEERAVAAVQAVALIHKYDLLSSPLDGIADIDNDTVQAARAIYETFTNPSVASAFKKVGAKLKKRRSGR